MAPRTRTTNTTSPAAKKTTAKKTPARTTTTRKPATPALTVVDVRTPLPTRRTIVGPHTAAQLTEARAALASATAQLPIPHLLWLTQIDGRAAAVLADGTKLIHTHQRNPEFTALVRCPRGGIHAHHVTNADTLHKARHITAACTQQHPNVTDFQHEAITRGVHRLIPARLSPLNVGLQNAKQALADTQPLNQADITAGLTARADNDTAKEHPQP